MYQNPDRGEDEKASCKAGARRFSAPTGRRHPITNLPREGRRRGAAVHVGEMRELREYGVREKKKFASSLGAGLDVPIAALFARV